MNNPKNPFYGHKSETPKPELHVRKKMPLAETIQKVKKANHLKRIEDLKKTYCVCSWHRPDNTRYVHRVTGQKAPDWVQKMLKDEDISHSMCLPCYILEHGVDAAIHDFGKENVHEALRQMVLR